MEVREARLACVSLPTTATIAESTGYKQTEGGVIPEGWEVHPLHSLVRSHNSGIYKSQTLYGHGCNIVGVADIYRVDKIAGQPFACVPLSSQELTKYKLQRNDLLYGESSLVREGIARTIYVTEQGEGTAFAWHTRRYSIDQRTLLSSYLYYYLQSRSARTHMISNSIQTAITGINTVAYFACPVIIPPYVEQEAIAKALDDVAALIESLEQLIAKKRQVKQGATQALLTGKKRLPGFSDEWKVSYLGNLAIFHKGKGLPKSALDPFSPFPCIHYGELFTQYSETIREVISRTDEFPDAFYSAAQDVLMPTSDVTPTGLAKASCITIKNVALGGDILVIRPDANHLYGPFLSYVIRYSKQQILQLVTGSTVFHLYASDMKKFTFVMPSVAEQRAIVCVLDDMETEIIKLETRLAKTRQLKQGMMQALLTGRIRLPLDATA